MTIVLSKSVYIFIEIYPSWEYRVVQIDCRTNLAVLNHSLYVTGFFMYFPFLLKYPIINLDHPVSKKISAQNLTFSNLPVNLVA